MPKKAKATPASRRRGPRKSTEQIQKLLEEVAAARAGGSTLANALKQVNVHYNTFSKWVKKLGKPAARTPAKKDRPGRKGKSKDEVLSVLNEVAALRSKGMTRLQALNHVGLSGSTHKYWSKKYQVEDTVRAVRAGRPRKTVAAAAVAKGSPVLSVLEEMVENRTKRHELEQAAKQIHDLDARFEELRKKLSS